MEQNKRKQCKTLSLKKKVEIINKLESGMTVKELVPMYGIAASTIYRFTKKKDMITAKTKSKILSERKTLHKPKDENLEKRLFAWFVKACSENTPVSGPILIAKAEEFKREMNIVKELKFSQGWLRGFKERHGIRLLSANEEKISANVEEITSFKKSFEQIVDELKVTPDLLYNTNETTLYWRCLPQKTLAKHCEKSAPGVKLNKDRITILTCANASGNHRLPLLVIGKSQYSRTLKGVHKLPVTYRSQKNAWMNYQIFRDWFFREFVPAVRENMTQIKASKDMKCLLLLDNNSAHPDETELISDCGRIFCCYLPSNITSQVQPIDQEVSRNLKLLYKQNFLMKMINSEVDLKEFQCSYTIKDALFSLATSWNDVKDSTFTNAWKQLMPSAYKNSHISAKPNIDSIEYYAKQLSSVQNFSREDIEKWVKEESMDTSNETDKDESIEFLANSEDNNSEDEDSNSTCSASETEMKLTLEEAENYMNKVISFFEETPSFNLSNTSHAHTLRNRIITHKLLKESVNKMCNELKKGIKVSVEDIS